MVLEIEQGQKAKTIFIPLDIIGTVILGVIKKSLG